MTSYECLGSDHYNLYPKKYIEPHRVSADSAGNALYHYAIPGTGIICPGVAKPVGRPIGECSKPFNENAYVYGGSRMITLIFIGMLGYWLGWLAGKDNSAVGSDGLSDHERRIIALNRQRGNLNS